jgi:uncharacterized protein (DUF488 family)
MENGQKTIWTIGHSTRSITEFIDILIFFKIELIADIRGLPGSNHYPHFNKENLEISLSEKGIGYTHLKALGGRRKTKKDSHNLGWRKDSFRGYADYMETENFTEGIDELEKISFHKRVALMCAEAVWWRCHRSMVADYLKLKGWEVIHILGKNKTEEHPYTQPAKIIHGRLSYPGE